MVILCSCAANWFCCLFQINIKTVCSSKFHVLLRSYMVQPSSAGHRSILVVLSAEQFLRLQYARWLRASTGLFGTMQPFVEQVPRFGKSAPWCVCRNLTSNQTQSGQIAFVLTRSFWNSLVWIRIQGGNMPKSWRDGRVRPVRAADERSWVSCLGLIFQSCPVDIAWVEGCSLLTAVVRDGGLKRLGIPDGIAMQLFVLLWASLLISMFWSMVAWGQLRESKQICIRMHCNLNVLPCPHDVSICHWDHYYPLIVYANNLIHPVPTQLVYVGSSWSFIFC